MTHNFIESTNQPLIHELLAWDRAVPGIFAALEAYMGKKNGFRFCIAKDAIITNLPPEMTTPLLPEPDLDSGMVIFRGKAGALYLHHFDTLTNIYVRSVDALAGVLDARIASGPGRPKAQSKRSDVKKDPAPSES